MKLKNLSREDNMDTFQKVKFNKELIKTVKLLLKYKGVIN